MEMQIPGSAPVRVRLHGSAILALLLTSSSSTGRDFFPILWLISLPLSLAGALVPLPPDGNIESLLPPLLLQVIKRHIRDSTGNIL